MSLYWDAFHVAAGERRRLAEERNIAEERRLAKAAEVERQRLAAVAPAKKRQRLAASELMSSLSAAST